MKKLIIGIVVITGILFAGIPTYENVQSQANNYTGFEENIGQVTDLENNPVPSVLFRMNLPGYNIFLTENGISFVLNQYDKEKDLVNFFRVDIEPAEGKIDKSKIELSDEVSGYSNYYLSHCPDGILFVKSYRYIKIKDLYPGIDWLWRCDEKVHNEFIVKPNADIGKIRLMVKWADLEIKDGKEIVYSTPLGKIKDGEIYVYEKDGKNVSAFYKKDEENYITFDINNYDKSKTLIIDPPLERLWATYYGGSDQDNCDGSREMGAITKDLYGNIFITGFTKSTNFPTLNPGTGAYFQGTIGQQLDVFIVKLSNTGARLWATYYGGTADEMGIAMTTDHQGNLFVTGNTFSSVNFPTYNPGGGAYFQGSGGSGDVFILKFTNAGVRQWATFYGGTFSDVGYSIATDTLDNIFITGNTFSTSNFPVYDPGSGAYFQATSGGSFDAFILKFSNTGARLWATYYGGTDDDNGYAVATDVSGNVFVTGMCRSTNFPILNPGGGAYYQTSILGYRTVFILKFTNTGVRTWATYYGGSTNDYGRAIATDDSGNVFVTGSSSSTNFPTYDPGGGAYYQATVTGGDDVFILKFTNAGLRQWATYYGGSAGDIARSITTTSSDKIYVAGNSVSSNVPTYDPGGGAFYQGTFGGIHDAFILGFTNAGAREWATYYGGTSTDYGMSIITDTPGNIFITGFTLSSTFPTYNPGGSAYFQGTNAGSYDAYILKFASATVGIEENPAISIKQNSKITSNTFFDNQIVLKLTNLKEREIRISIFNTLGANLYGKTLSATSPLILDDEEIRNLKSGIYFLRLESRNQKLGEIKVIKR